MKKFKIIIVEDEKILRVSLTDDLTDAGYIVKAFANPIEALNYISENEVDIVLSDIRMPRMNGIEMLSRTREINPEIITIMMTAFGTVDSAVEAMKKGAYDYLSKPFHIDELLLLLDRIRELKRIKEENINLKTQIDLKYGVDSFIGKSKTVQSTLELVRTIAAKKTTVLIKGETGTGKELLTNIIHYNSDRKNKPFIKVSCASLAREVFESELFGHEKGAFTGAAKERPGRFELADGGTLYLDDADDIPLDLQVKLLRVLQEEEFERVGGNETLKVDVRLIASTKADMLAHARSGRFREDLYYRLNIFPINVAPLRERKEDIPLLIEHFIDIFSPNRKIKISDEAMNALCEYDWNGNVRELKNLMERFVLLSSGETIDYALLPPEITHNLIKSQDVAIGEESLDDILTKIEVDLISKALRIAKGNQARAAELLKIPPSTLRTKIYKYNIKD